MKTELKTDNSNNIHVFRVNRVTAKVKEPSNQVAINKVNSRTRLSAETKRSICEDHIQNPKTTQEALALKYGCKRTTVAKIIKAKDRWLSINSDDIIAKRFRQRNSRYPLVENSLMLWLQEEHNDISLVTDQMLRSQARQYAQEYHVDGVEDFKASSSWVSNFKQKYMTSKVNISENSTVSDNNVTMQSNIPNKISVIQENPALLVAESPSSEAVASIANSTNIQSSKIIDTVARSTTDLNSGETTASDPKQSVVEIDGDTDRESYTTSTSHTEDEDESNEYAQLDADDALNVYEISDGDDFMEVENGIAKTSSVIKDNYRDNEIMGEAEYNGGKMKDDIMEGIDDDRDHYDDHDYGGDQDYDDGYSVTEQPCCAEIEKTQDTTYTALDIGEKTSTESIQVVKKKNSKTEKASLKTNAEPAVTSQENTKENAKRHLEAALAFYSSKSDGTNQSMSANMIKLILQNDF